MVQLLREFAGGSQVDIELFNDVDRQANGAGLVHDRPFNRLADPPGGVGRETEAAFGVELLDSPDQAQVALFNQVQQRQATIDIAPGNFHHQPQVAFNHAFAPGRVATLRQPRKMNFFGRRE